MKMKERMPFIVGAVSLVNIMVAASTFADHTTPTPAAAGTATPMTISRTQTEKDDTRAMYRDNTEVNKRDASNRTVTPFDQSNEQRHIDITANIRRQIMDSNAMSTNAQNVKIITTADNKVVLRGVVDSSKEQQLIEQIARRNAPNFTVINSLEVQ